MTAKHFENISEAKLSDYIEADKFRTILPKYREFPLGFSEIPVEIQLKKNVENQLGFPVPWDGGLYGCLRCKRELQKKLGLECPVISATISDWDNRFVLVFEAENEKKDTAFYITKDEVVELLKTCRRVPEQR